jgi:hypothetical protein
MASTACVRVAAVAQTRWPCDDDILKLHGDQRLILDDEDIGGGIAGDV